MAGEPASRLDGWKAIADYLGRDVRTAQRWRDERGMPVHRIPGGKGGAVFADRSEIDAWLVQPKVAADVNVRAPNTKAIRVIDDHTNVPLNGPNGVVSLSRLRTVTVRRVATIMAVLVLVGSAGAAVIRIQTAALAIPARFEFSGNALVARGADDSILWTFRPPERPGSVVDGAVVNDVRMAGTARLNFRSHDSDVLALLALTKVAEGPDKPEALRFEVFCLTSGGKFRWMFYPRNRLTFADREFAGPWRIHAWAALPGSKPRLWVSFIDNVWWPTFIESLDADGKAETAFVNSGHLVALAPVQIGAATYLLAGGVNNEYRSAVLAVLDPENEPSSSPQTPGTPFACDHCPRRGPFRYFVFPRLEVAVAHGVPYEYANTISGGPGASSVEISIRDMTELNVRAVYRFSEGLMPESVAMSDRYWEIHREMFRTGKLDHAPEDCPERNDGVTVRMWQPAGGWSEIKVLPTFAPRETR